MGALIILLANAPVARAAVPDAASSPPSVPDTGRVALELAGDSTITFHATDGFGGFDGTVPVASFSAELDPTRLATAQASILVNADAITTGNFLRDLNAARTVFEASRYPTIRYTLASVEADPGALPDGGTARLVVHGQLRMHGVRHEVVATGKAVRHGDDLEVTLSMPVRLSAFGMTRPRFLTVVVDDTVSVDIHLRLRLRTSGG